VESRRETHTNRTAVSHASRESSFSGSSPEGRRTPRNYRAYILAAWTISQQKEEGPGQGESEH